MKKTKTQAVWDAINTFPVGEEFVFPQLFALLDQSEMFMKPSQLSTILWRLNRDGILASRKTNFTDSNKPKLFYSRVAGKVPNIHLPSSAGATKLSSIEIWPIIKNFPRDTFTSREIVQDAIDEHGEIDTRSVYVYISKLHKKGFIEKVGVGNKPTSFTYRIVSDPKPKESKPTKESKPWKPTKDKSNLSAAEVGESIITLIEKLRTRISELEKQNEDEAYRNQMRENQLIDRNADLTQELRKQKAEFEKTIEELKKRLKDSNSHKTLDMSGMI